MSSAQDINGRKAQAEVPSQAPAHPPHPRPNCAEGLELRGSASAGGEVVQALLLPDGWLHGTAETH